MVKDSITYYVWIGGSCDYGHKERAVPKHQTVRHAGNDGVFA